MILRWLCIVFFQTVFWWLNMKCWWCSIRIYSESILFFAVVALSLISSHTTAVSLITTGLSTCLLRAIQQNTRFTHTHPTKQSRLSVAQVWTIRTHVVKFHSQPASCALGPYFHISIMETLECSTANAMVTLNRSGRDNTSCCQMQERPTDSISRCGVTTK